MEALDSSASIDPTLAGFLLVAAVIFIGVASSKIFEKLRIPMALPLIATGVLVGPALGLISVETIRPIVPHFATFAVLIMLIEMGMEMNVQDILKRSGRALALTVVGFGFSTFLVGLAAKLILGYPWPLALLLGAVLSGQDAAVMYPLKKMHVGEEAKSLILVESALTDPIGIVVVTTLLTGMKNYGQLDIMEAGRSLLLSFALGLFLGVIAGVLWLKVLKSRKEAPFNYILTLAVAMALYAFAEVSVPGSGTLTLVFFGIVLGNSKEFGRMLRSKLQSGTDEYIRPFHSEISLFVRSFFFVLLGIMLEPSMFLDPILMILGAVFIMIMLLVRFVSTELCVSGSRSLIRDKKFVWLLYSKGLASVVLATFIVSALEPLPAFAEIDLGPFVKYTFLMVIAFIAISGFAAFSFMGNGENCKKTRKPAK